MSEENWVFQITDVCGKIYRIWGNGEIDGFGPDCHIINKIPNLCLQGRLEAANRITELEQQLEAEGEHTAAANANIDRLNTEIERITRRQQGILAEEQSRKY